MDARVCRGVGGGGGRINKRKEGKCHEALEGRAFMNVLILLLFLHEKRELLAAWRWKIHNADILACNDHFSQIPNHKTG